ncbi:protein NRT1/ PTR FAMILY 4.5-like isoform X2 [Rhodamnia argentea]|uniref:Protein NRT1/ PTR FAMILY 4.5-like isoform X2 n=1 Tax=Rhodamnia argentea TaxID=178133 RepID=A0A8B8QXD4_9MYRT|nr:protein NRT1/ PTR FAMILY 4.5-like isoform X2 [Rhodamnia argentea]
MPLILYIFSTHQLTRSINPSLSLSLSQAKLQRPEFSAMEGQAITKTSYDSPGSWKKKGKGGFRASGFIFALSGLDNMGFIANMATMVLYFYLVMHFNVSTASNTLTNFLGSTFLLTLVGAFISDTYLSRLTTCLIFGTIEVLALAMLTIEAHAKHLHPNKCGKSSCIHGGTAVYFYANLCLLAIGYGGVRGAFPALGADQFDQTDPVEAASLPTFFNYLVLCTTAGATFGVTAIVWVSMNKGWHWGFLISTIASTIGFVVLAVGKPFYRVQRHGESPVIRIWQVVLLAIKNRKLPLPENSADLFEMSDKASSVLAVAKIAHTDQLRFLDKAAILPKESKPEPWKVCTVTQVEEVKVLTRMLPILASTIIMNTCLAQLQTFSVQQGRLMDPYLGSLNIPTPSIPVIPLFFMSILIPIYEYVFVPFARKLTGHPSGITQLQRVGVGLVLSVISMVVAGFVEVKRRDECNKSPPYAISLFWLALQYSIFGIADMFTLVGLLEFFYKEAPVGMRSLSTSFTWLSLSFGYFLSSIFVNLINSVTERITPSKQGWLHGVDLNKNNVNLFYWFLAILSTLNFGVYLVAASWYKYKTEDLADSEMKPMAPNGVPLITNNNDMTDRSTQNDASVAFNPVSSAAEPVAKDNKAVEKTEAAVN